jgi:hypothetical protein
VCGVGGADNAYGCVGSGVEHRSSDGKFRVFFVFRSKRVDKLPGWSLRSGTFEHNHRAWLGANIVVVGFVSWLISPKI